MLRRSCTLLLVLIAALTVGACGGGSSAADQDVDSLLKETFAGGKQVKSGNLDLKVRIDAQGGEAQGPVDVALSGPFQSTGDKQLPKFRLAAKFSGAGQNVSGGATSTGDKGFVSFQGQEYELTDEVFQQFRQGFEQSQAQQGGQEDQSLATLGIDPRKWLTNPKNEGEAKVGDEDTVKITGDVDVPRLLDDVNNALQKAASLSGQAGANVPEKLTEQQKREVQEAVKDLNVEIYTGAEDKILRRMVIALDIQAPAGNAQGIEDAKMTFDLSITGVNEDQEIEAPANPKPFDELAQQLGGLGLGGLGGGGGGSAGGGAAPGASGGASSEALEQYSACIREAGSDAAEAQKCAELLTP